MILFCDTSALVKLYVEEDQSAAVAEHAEASEVVAVCRIAWVEMMSSMARRARERPPDASALDEARRRFVADWPHYLAVDVTQELVALAGDYADTFALRAYDCVQLAAARIVHREMADEVRFACFDSKLVKAARVLGIEAI